MFCLPHINPIMFIVLENFVYLLFVPYLIAASSNFCYSHEA